MVTGGLDDNEASKWELYNPDTFTNVHEGDYPGKQIDPLVQSLPNGKVLFAGGLTWDLSGNLPTQGPTQVCYLYDPTGMSNSIEKDINSINSFKLYQNFPNPFNPTTTISFKISQSSNVSLIIYDLLGREINRLIDNRLYASGTYQIVWNGKDQFGIPVSSGMYLYRLEASDKIITRKMLLIK